MCAHMHQDTLLFDCNVKEIEFIFHLRLKEIILLPSEISLMALLYFFWEILFYSCIDQDSVDLD